MNRFEGRYAFLSNFYPCKIEYQGIEYPSTEHYYVAMKVNTQQLIDGVHYTPADFREVASRVKTPGAVKHLGQKAQVRKDWDTKKLEVMIWALREKFKYPELAEMLLSTGNQELIEGNWWHDVFWGVCSCEKCGNKGKNHLGKMLMQVREELIGYENRGLNNLFK